MQRLTLIGGMAVIASGFGSAILLHNATFGSRWIVVGLLAFVALWLVGIVAIIRAKRNDTVDRENASDGCAVKPADLYNGDLKKYVQPNAFAPPASDVDPYRRFDTTRADPHHHRPHLRTLRRRQPSYHLKQTRHPR